MIFADKPTVKITATIEGLANKITFDGITADSTLTPENAKTQIDKIFGITNQAVVTDGMTRTMTQEAIANG